MAITIVSVVLSNRLDQLVELLEIFLVHRLVVLGVGAVPCNFITLKFDPALLLGFVRESCLHFDHLIQTEYHLGWEPTDQATFETKQDLKLGIIIIFTYKTSTSLPTSGGSVYRSSSESSEICPLS